MCSHRSNPIISLWIRHSPHTHRSPEKHELTQETCPGSARFWHQFLRGPWPDRGSCRRGLQSPDQTDGASRISSVPAAAEKAGGSSVQQWGTLPHGTLHAGILVLAGEQSASLDGSEPHHYSGTRYQYCQHSDTGILLPYCHRTGMHMLYLNDHCFTIFHYWFKWIDYKSTH